MIAIIIQAFALTLFGVMLASYICFSRKESEEAKVLVKSSICLVVIICIL